MDDNLDKALEALKFHIKKEIVDNYFADRVYLEEDLEILQEETAAYRQGVELVSSRFLAFYQALGPEPALKAALDLLGLKEPPFYQKFQALGEAVRRDLLRPYRRRGWTATRCYRNLVYDVYEQLQAETAKLQEQYQKLNTHLRLLNEDIDKFNLSYDFGLIAAQIEALEGCQEVLSGGLMCGEREELSTRMRFKRQKLTDEELPPVAVLPPLAQIKGKLAALMDRLYTP